VQEIHLFEPSGYAGVFQHSCRLGELLSARGLNVMLHTGHEHEDVPASGVELCACSWWPRRGRRRPGRSASIAARLLGRTIPHLRRAVPDDAVLHVQGIAAAGALTLAVLGAGRLAGRRVVYSPHDTFSRRGWLDDRLLRIALRLPDAVIVHARATAGTVAGAYYAPLVQLVPQPSDSGRERWRNEWRAGDDVAVVLFAGMIRPEKRLDVLIESARSWPPNRRLAVVGQDRGGWEAASALALEAGVEVAARIEFVDLDEFAAAIAAADVVVAPHTKATQSGVLSLARQLGVPAIAADVGGMPELATRTFPAGDADALTRAIEVQLAEPSSTDRELDEELAVHAHLCAYGLAT
jgi:glycosyltransferase involved in cell wall biosynthesis